MEANDFLMFSLRPWYIKFWEKSLELHPYLSFISPAKGRIHFRAKKWLIMTTKIIDMMFLNTILCAIIVQNSGGCDNLTSATKCNEYVSLDLTSKLCTWNEQTKQCTYNTPSNSFLSVLILTAIVVVCSQPLDRLCAYMVEMCARTVVFYGQKRRIDSEELNEVDIGPQDDYDNDESQLMSLPAKMMLASRVAMIKRLIDDVTPEQELKSMLESVDKLHAQNSKGAPEILQILDRFRLQQSVHKSSLPVTEWLTSCGLAADDKKLLLLNIKRSRARANRLVEQLSEIHEDDKKELLLIKHFVVDLQGSFKRKIAFQSFFGFSDSDNIENPWLQHYLSLIFLPIYLVGTLTYIFLFGVYLGPAASRIWLQTMAFSVLQDSFILKPILIWLKFIAITSTVSDDIRDILAMIRDRVKKLFSRAKCNLENHSLLMQHTNSACRAARKFPHLKTSKLLISLNDFDLPSAASKKTHVLRRILSPMVVVLMMMLALFMEFPEEFQEIGAGVAIAMCTNLSFLGMYYLSEKSIVLPVVAGLFIVFAVIVREVILSKAASQKASGPAARSRVSFDGKPEFLLGDKSMSLFQVEAKEKDKPVTYFHHNWKGKLTSGGEHSNVVPVELTAGYELSDEPFFPEEVKRVSEQGRLQDANNFASSAWIRRFSSTSSQDMAVHSSVVESSIDSAGLETAPTKQNRVPTIQNSSMFPVSVKSNFLIVSEDEFEFDSPNESDCRDKDTGNVFALEDDSRYICEPIEVKPFSGGRRLSVDHTKTAEKDDKDVFSVHENVMQKEIEVLEQEHANNELRGNISDSKEKRLSMSELSRLDIGQNNIELHNTKSSKAENINTEKKVRVVRVGESNAHSIAVFPRNNDNDDIPTFASNFETFADEKSSWERAHRPTEAKPYPHSYDDNKRDYSDEFSDNDNKPSWARNHDARLRDAGMPRLTGRPLPSKFR